MDWLSSFRPTLTAREEEHTFTTIYCTPNVPDDSSQQKAVGTVVVGGVVMSPQLRSWQREMPELVDETPYPLLLSLQPLVIPYVPRLHKHTHIHDVHTCTIHVCIYNVYASQYYMHIVMYMYMYVAVCHLLQIVLVCRMGGRCSLALAAVPPTP